MWSLVILFSVQCSSVLHALMAHPSTPLLPGDRWRPSKSKCQSVLRASNLMESHGGTREEMSINEQTNTIKHCILSRYNCWQIMHKCSSAVRRVITPMNSFQLSKDVLKEKYIPFVPSNSHASRALVASNKAVHNDAQRPQQSWRKASCSAKLQDTKRQKTSQIHTYPQIFWVCLRYWFWCKGNPQPSDLVELWRPGIAFGSSTQENVNLSQWWEAEEHNRSSWSPFSPWRGGRKDMGTASSSRILGKSPSVVETSVFAPQSQAQKPQSYSNNTYNTCVI